MSLISEHRADHEQRMGVRVTFAQPSEDLLSLAERGCRRLKLGMFPGSVAEE